MAAHLDVKSTETSEFMTGLRVPSTSSKSLPPSREYMVM